VLKTIRFNYENGCLKKNLKMSRRITFLVSRPIWTYELIASILIEGGNLMVLPSSLFSQGHSLVIASRVGVEFKRKIEQKGEYNTAYDNQQSR